MEGDCEGKREGGEGEGACRRRCANVNHIIRMTLDEVSWREKEGDGAREEERWQHGRVVEVEKSEKAWNLTPPSDDCRGGSGAVTAAPPPPLRRCSRSACSRSAAAAAAAALKKKRVRQT